MTARSFFAGLWRGLDGLRKVLHLIVLLLIFGFVVRALRAGMPHIPATAALLIAARGASSSSSCPATRRSARSSRHAATATPRRCCGT